MTPVQLLLLPAVVHVGLVFVLLLRSGRARVAAVKAGRVRIKDIALDNSKWPDEVRKLGNSYENQFELPVLYYALLPLVLYAGLADGVAIALSWAFVALRLVHSLIHTGGNAVIRRFRAFVAGVACLMLMWGWFALRLFVIG